MGNNKGVWEEVSNENGKKEVMKMGRNQGKREGTEEYGKKEKENGKKESKENEKKEAEKMGRNRRVWEGGNGENGKKVKKMGRRK